MWQVTWIAYGLGPKPKVQTLSTPIESVAWTVYWALLTLGWKVRIWSPKKELAA